MNDVQGAGCAAQEEEIAVSPLALSVVTPMDNEREAVDHFVAREPAGRR